MRPLEQLLVQVPVVYGELEHALVPGRSGEPSDSSPDPRHRPAPGRLDVTEHRHLLLKGLRWWVSAVVDRADLRTAAEWASVGDSPARMCALILANLEAMAPEDRTELATNLHAWLWDAFPYIGKVANTAVALPREALDRRVPVHVAAQALAVSVSTVKRRTLETREGGTVLLRDAAGPLCVASDLPPAWCDHCRRDRSHGVRTVTAEVAQ